MSYFFVMYREKSYTNPPFAVFASQMSDSLTGSGKYENDPIDIDTSVFDSYRKSVVERDFIWEDSLHDKKITH